MNEAEIMALEGSELDVAVGEAMFGSRFFCAGKERFRALKRRRAGRAYTFHYEFNPSRNHAHIFEAEEMVPEDEKDN